MSKNKTYHNYNNYSNNNRETKIEEPVVEAAVEETVEAQVKEEVNEEVTPIEAPVEETVEEPVVEETVQIIGVVTGCSRLKVRQEPNTDADVIGVIEEGTEVEIDEEKSTSDFYKVYTAVGFVGFCMKKFIKIK